MSVSERSWRDWLLRQRTSARLAFLLRLVTMAVNSAMSLLWTRLLIMALGNGTYGLLLSFQGALRMVTLGDFGITAALSMRTGQLLGAGEDERLKKFLASARALFCIVAFALGFLTIVLAPWIPGWLGFAETPGSGSLVALFVVGGVLIWVSLIGGYFHGLNAAYGTVTWPILPGLLFGQAALAVQWFAASRGAPLWGQVLATVVIAAASTVFTGWLLRVSHPWLGNLRPFRFDSEQWRDLGTSSGWAYLYVIGNFVFTTTDRLLVNAGFGAAAVPSYLINYKLPELAMQAVLSASFVSQNKINLWIADPTPTAQDRARTEVERLCLFQSLAGSAVALGYLAINSVFVATWLDESYRLPLAINWAFALTLAVSTGGDAAIQIAGLCGRRGLRTAGFTIGLTAALNFGLSFWAMQRRSLEGIAFATVLAQSILSFILARYLCRHLKISIFRWLLRSWLLPVGGVAVMAALQLVISPNEFRGAALLLLAALPVWLLQCRLAGLTPAFVRHELTILRDLLR